MYILIKIGNYEFGFGNARDGVERRRQDESVGDNHRKTSDRRRQKPPSGQDVEVEEEKERD